MPCNMLQTGDGMSRHPTHAGTSKARWCPGRRADRRRHRRVHLEGKERFLCGRASWRRPSLDGFAGILSQIDCFEGVKCSKNPSADRHECYTS